MSHRHPGIWTDSGIRSSSLLLPAPKNWMIQNLCFFVNFNSGSASLHVHCCRVAAVRSSSSTKESQQQLCAMGSPGTVQ